MYPFFYLFTIILEKFGTVFSLKIIFSKILFFLTGIRPKVIIEKPLTPGKAYLFCPNHSSYLDILLSYLVIPEYFLMMGKAELTRVPLFRIFFKKMNIAVERKSKMDSHRAFLRASKEIDKGTSLIMFAEGTIPEHTPKIGAFKNGPFKLAIEKQIPIVPVTYLNNWQILPDGRKRKNGGKPGIANVIIHAPIETTGLKEEDAGALRQKVFHIIDSTIRNTFK